VIDGGVGNSIWGRSAPRYRRGWYRPDQY